METKFLKDIGLTDNEIRIYLELIKLNEALASELADRTGVNRTLTYQILKNLLKKGLIAYVIKNNVKYFKAGHPSKLIDFLNEKQMNIQKLIPDLEKLPLPKEKKYSVELYEGKEGLIPHGKPSFQVWYATDRVPAKDKDDEITDLKPEFIDHDQLKEVWNKYSITFRGDLLLFKVKLSVVAISRYKDKYDKYGYPRYSINNSLQISMKKR